MGTVPYIGLYGGAEVEVYFINDPDCVGTRYPDGGRIAPGRGWLEYQSAMEYRPIKEMFYKLRTEWLKTYDPERLRQEEKEARSEIKGPTPLRRLNLKNRSEEPKEKPKLNLSKPVLKLQQKQPDVGSAPGLKLKLKGK